MKVFILAGGKGTRLKHLTKDTPKPMIPILDKPILEYQIDLLKKFDLTDVMILINYLGDKIEDYFGNGRKWGLNIKYFEEKVPLGTAGGLKKFESSLKEDFIVIYGDLLLNIDLKKFIETHQNNKQKFGKKYIGTLLTRPSNHPEDCDLLDINKDGVIVEIHSKPHSDDLVYKNLDNAAVYIFSPEITEYIPDNNEATDFGKDIFPVIVKKKHHVLGTHITSEYQQDMGTLDRLEGVIEDVKSGKYQRRSFSTPIPAIFLDRDGVLIELIDHLNKAEDVKMISDATDAVKLINQSEFYAVMITNQSVVARNMCTIADVLQIHKVIETHLGNDHAYLDRTYFCPHHASKNIPNANPEFNIECNCRKPKPGMFLQAQKDLNIDLNNSYYIGDMISDYEAAQNAGLKFIGVETGYGLSNFNNEQIVKKHDILDAVKYILDLTK